MKLGKQHVNKYAFCTLPSVFSVLFMSFMFPDIGFSLPQLPQLQLGAVSVSVTHVTSSMRTVHMTSAARNWLQENCRKEARQFEPARSFLIISQIETILQSILRKSAGAPGKIPQTRPRTVVRGAACDFLVLKTRWHQIWVRVRQVMTQSVSWKRTCG